MRWKQVFQRWTSAHADTHDVHVYTTQQWPRLNQSQFNSYQLRKLRFRDVTHWVEVEIVHVYENANHHFMCKHHKLQDSCKQSKLSISFSPCLCILTHNPLLQPYCQKIPFHTPAVAQRLRVVNNLNTSFDVDEWRTSRDSELGCLCCGFLEVANLPLRLTHVLLLLVVQLRYAFYGNECNTTLNKPQQNMNRWTTVNTRKR